MPLSDTAIRKAKPSDKPYRLSDGGGLYVWITPAGGKHWRLRYEVAGREKIMTLGTYPELSLAEAREARSLARTVRREGRDPMVEQRRRRLVTRDATTFEAVARTWHALQVPRWKPVHARDVLGSLVPVFAVLGRLSLVEINPPMILAVLRAIEARGAIETAHRTQQRISAVFCHAIASGLAAVDPAHAVRGALAPVPDVMARPAVTTLEAARRVLRDVEAIPAHPATKLANRFLALTAARPVEVRAMPWGEVDGTLWRIPAARMKMRRDHWVPLAPAALDVLEAMRVLSGRGPLVFPNTRSAHKPLSENAVGYLLDRAGYDGVHVPHGWRSTFSTIMNERHPADRAVIDLMLAHAPGKRGATEAIYNRGLYLARRREIAEEWAGLLLEGMPAAGELVEGRRR